MTLFEAVEVDDVITHNLLQSVFGNILERLSNEFPGVWPGGVGVRVVGRPGNILWPKDLPGKLRENRDPSRSLP